MPRFRRVRITSDIEKKIITGMIVSTKFLKAVYRDIKPHFFQFKYASLIAQWVLNFFEEYKEAPKKMIQNIYRVEKESLDPAEQNIIEAFLESLSEQYDEESFNHQYLVDKTNEYLVRSDLKAFFERGHDLIQTGQFERAEKHFSSYTAHKTTLSNAFDPFCEEEIDKFDESNTEGRLFKLPKAAGQLIGWFERSWLVAVSAPEKRGKSWIIEELVFQAFIAKKKVVWFSLEMNEKVMRKRIYKRLTATADKLEKDLMIPIFDCERNQTGECQKTKRKNRITLVDKDGDKPEYNRDMKYKPCSVCRNDGTNNFVCEYWHTTQRIINKTKIEEIKKRAKIFKRRYGDNLRCVSYPAFSANFGHINYELDMLEDAGFEAEVVAIDYFDILGEEKSNLSERGLIDYTWKRGKNLADVRRCVVITADQSNKASRSKRSVGDTDTSEDKRKDAHLDVRVALNQTKEEKADGVLRLSVLFHRHNYFNKMREVMIMQQLTVVQPMLDSEWFIFKPKEQKEAK